MLTPELSELRAEWFKAKQAWNACNSLDVETQIARGEDLYFAASFLIEHLEELSQ
jgi:hypothetical protein